MNFKLNLARTKTLKLANDISPINSLKTFFYKRNLEFYGAFTKGSQNSVVLSQNAVPSFSPAHADIAQQVPVLGLIFCFFSQQTSRQEFTEVYVY